MLNERIAMFWRGLMIIGATLLMSCTATAPENEATEVASPQAAVGCDSDSENFAEFMSPGWDRLVDYPNNTQLMIIGSDPQAYRYMSKRSPYAENIDDAWPNAVIPVLQAIRAERQAVNYYVPFIINGDMTEFGHGAERRTTRFYFKNYLPGGVRGPLFLPGLGNHDYDNNVGDCGNNGCARDSVCDLITWAQAINPKNAFDYQYVSGNRHRGSLAYSVTVGRVHIVQLNQEPFYTRSFETGGGSSGKPKRYFDITGSMQWLQDDLRAASQRGEVIIINMHKPDSWVTDAQNAGWFGDLVSRYNVTAIFAGHYHKKIGRFGTRGDVPVFLSGGLLAKSYLRLKFDWTNMQLSVEPVLLDEGPQTQSRVALRKQESKNDLIITLYEHENRQGASCKFALKDAVHRWIISSHCSAFESLTSSVDVQGFTPGSELCFLGDFDRKRCVTGGYRGDFSISTFIGMPVLPSGLLMTASGGSMNDTIKGVSLNTGATAVTLYEHEGMQGEQCRLALKPHESVDVDSICGPLWKFKVSSARVSGFKPRTTLKFKGMHPWVNQWSYHNLTFDGGFDIPSFTEPGPLPQGVTLNRINLKPVNDDVGSVELFPHQ